jgi:hypothetical protein
MNLAKKLGCIGFAIGFIGPVLFYANPSSFPTFESTFMCPWCPIVDWAFATRWAWVGIGIRLGLVSGLLLAIAGLAVGYTASRIARAN